MKNRIIKFRAWDNDNQEWLYAEPIYGFFPSLPMDEEGTDPESIKRREQRYGAIQEYTGLKDKNGTEIYEGDLIKAGEMIYQIAWDFMAGRLMPFTTEPLTTNQYIASSGNPIRNWNWLDQGQGIYYQDIKKQVKVEVIGNIYENPDYLSKKEEKTV